MTVKSSSSLCIKSQVSVFGSKYPEDAFTSASVKFYPGKQNIFNIPTAYSTISSKGRFNSGMGAYQTIVEGRNREGEWREGEIHLPNKDRCWDTAHY